jgi:toxin YoeB
MRKILLEDNAIEDFEFWSKNDLKTLKKIAELFVAIAKNPFEGIGKPELLKGNLTGYWSRRINEEHRIVYAVDQEKIVVISCRYHYEFK